MPVARFLLAILTVASIATAQEAPRPNVVLIVADDLGFGDLGCYGQERIRTPHLDRLAAEGLRFSRFYAGSTVCAPSRCVLMTGLHTGHAFIRNNSGRSLRPTDLTVAEVLRESGYETALVGKWGLGQEGTSGVPTRKGFASFFGYLNQRHAHNYYPSFLMRGTGRVALENVVPDEGAMGQGVATKRVAYSHDLFTDEALRFLDAKHARPFFLFLSYTIPHANNEAGRAGMEVPDFGPDAQEDWPEPERGFAGMVHRLDRDVGRVMARLKERGLDESTLVLFTSDNGPHREGGHDADFFDSNGPLRGIKRDLYEGGIRVPLIARWPGRIAAGRASALVSSFADFMPTVAELAGAATPPSDGISLVPTLLGEDERQAHHDYLYWEFDERGSADAVVAGDWKAVRRPRLTGALEVYDLAADPGETHDLAAEQPEVAARLTAFLNEAHDPPARTHYRGREIATTMHWLGAEWLTRPSREREERTELMLRHMKVQEGQTVADVGAGNGYLALRLAKLVGESGRVLATDIQPEMLRFLESRARLAGTTNVTTVACTPLDCGLAPASCDLILLVDVYHELDRPELTLRQLRAALTADGRLYLVEFRAEDPAVPIKPLHKMSKEQILKELRPNGFELVDDFDGLPWQHLMGFRAARD